MTDGDDDIAAALPRPPLPAPARREAAIAEALRRFDGAEPASAAKDRRTARPASWWSPRGRPYAGALAGAFLVALVGLPFVWSSFDRSVPGGGRGERPRVEAPGAGPAAADSEAEPAPAVRPPAPGSPAAADEVPAEAPAPLARAGPVAKAGEAPAASAEPVAPSPAEPHGDVVVTGSRIRRPNLESTSPVTVVGEESVAADDSDSAITVTGTRSRYVAPRRRGDWNACTIDDPGRDLAACRKRAGPAANRASGAATRVAEGLSQGWEGDLEEAVDSFDRAIALEPRSSEAYLNRALARRRLGDLDGALADLDRAVRFAPRAARYYYQRSLVLHQRGDHHRAESDEERAVALDPRYRVAVKGPQ
jgi:hypothetical protein